MVAPNALLAALRAVVGDAHVLTDPDVVAGQVRDWTGRFSAPRRPSCGRRRSTRSPACSRGVPRRRRRGGPAGRQHRSGRRFGAAARRDRARPAPARRARSGRRAHGPDDGAGGRDDRAACTRTPAPPAGNTASTWASRDTATVGGTIATNAGGVHVLRYGSTRRQVIGVEAVFADGRVMRRLDGLEKDNTGYDLAGLLCGSEGTLAVITAARLRLVPRPAHVVVALLAFDDVDAALDAVGGLRRSVELPAGGGAVLPGRSRPRVRHGSAWRGRSRRGTARSCWWRRPRARDPTVELAADDRLDLPASPTWRSRATTAPPATSGATARRTPRRSICSALRTSSTSPCPPISSPASSREVRDQVSAVAPDAAVWLFGHAADGNIHVNVTGVDPRRRPRDRRGVAAGRRAGTDPSAPSTASVRPSGSGCSLVRSPAEIDAFRAIKRALDPDSGLNPHVLLPTEDDR